VGEEKGPEERTRAAAAAVYRLPPYLSPRPAGPGAPFTSASAASRTTPRTHSSSGKGRGAGSGSGGGSGARTPRALLLSPDELPATDLLEDNEFDEVRATMCSATQLPCHARNTTVQSPEPCCWPCVTGSGSAWMVHLHA